jgi:UDP-N-acetyl-D-glucosamine dehydrogenase
VLGSANKVTIIGQGYVGLPLAMAACRAGWDVTGFDISKDVVQALGSGISHVEDISDFELQQCLKMGKYKASASIEEANQSEIYVICVPTPLDDRGLPDLSHLDSAVRLFANALPGDALVISESTSYPGTVREFIAPLVASLRKDKGIGISFASAPERVDPTNEKWKIGNTPRLVSGIDEASTLKALAFYRSICESVIEVSRLEVAEMAKLLENTFRQVNIALVNQLVPVCRALEIDIREVVEAAGTKPFGYMKFMPSAGVGGHCIPIDPAYLLWKARQLGFDLSIVEESTEMNTKMPEYVSSRFMTLAKPVSGSNVAILGVAYKAGMSDIRQSPALYVAQSLQSHGYEVLWSDPLVKTFNGHQVLRNQEIAGAIVVTAQDGLPVAELAQVGVPILDCTGVYRGINGVEQL